MSSDCQSLTFLKSQVELSCISASWNMDQCWLTTHEKILLDRLNSISLVIIFRIDVAFFSSFNWIYSLDAASRSSIKIGAHVLRRYCGFEKDRVGWVDIRGSMVKLISCRRNFIYHNSFSSSLAECLPVPLLLFLPIWHWSCNYFCTMFILYWMRMKNL